MSITERIEKEASGGKPFDRGAANTMLNFLRDGGPLTEEPELKEELLERLDNAYPEEMEELKKNREAQNKKIKDEMEKRNK